MKRFVQSGFSVLLTLLLLLSCLPAALADGEQDASAADSVLAEDGLMQPEETGIIDGGALTAWMDDYVALNGLGGEYQRFSVGFCYTATGDCWFYHADDWMYSASLYKVPVSMLMAEKEAAGEIFPDTVITNMYGSGTLEKLESTALILSSNDSGHIMVEYLGGTYNGKCAGQTVRFTPLGESYFTEEDFEDLSYYTARYMTYVMKTLFEGGDETFPHVEDYLREAQPGEYYNTDATLSHYGVAQKYGAFVEQNGNNNNHCAAIIYTPTPIIAVVMTRNVGDYQRRIGEVGAHLAQVALELDEKQAALEQEALAKAAAEAEAQAAAEAEAAAAAATPNPGPAAPAVSAAPASDVSPAVPSVSPSPDEGNARNFPLWPVLAALFVAAVVAVAVALRSAGRRKKRRRKKRPSAPGKAASAATASAPDAVPEPPAEAPEAEPRHGAPESRPQRRSGSSGYKPRH